MPDAQTTTQPRTETGLEIAVIGMAGRFPAADDIDQLWRNLVSGVDAISRLEEHELRGSGITSGEMSKENYVRAKGVFPRLEYFDANFFGYTPADATVLDPQVRALHEEVYHALEDAGYSGEGQTRSIGLFLGATNNMPWEFHSLRRFVMDEGVMFSGAQLNDKDFAATRIAHSLGLQGPAVTLHTACSTSLVAIDTACRHLWTGSCQIALAGGSGLTLPHKKGYLYEPNMIFSPDGTCRAFDEDASGTVEGNGVGVVALKRLTDAVRDGDRIYAVIKGSAVNNDGNRKVGYSAPSIEGQAEVIRRAHRMARVQPDSISYVEAHGTGTALGDPIEVEALRQAFGDLPQGTVGIGSLKSTIGHADVAAGVSSFIKTCKVLERELMPASLHYSRPNPRLGINNGPFYVVGANTPLPGRVGDAGLARAAVSAFGIGGTNVHVVLEQAPRLFADAEQRRPFQTLVIAGASESAVSTIKGRLAEHLECADDLNPAAIAWTMQRRQPSLPFRFSIPFADAAGLARSLRESIAAAQPATRTVRSAPDVVFLFSGLGAQHVGMARGLYESEPVFRDQLDLCFELSEAIGRGTERCVFLGDSDQDTIRLNTIAIAQSLLFMVQYATAQLLLSWGIQPRAMIGHSTGELVAACVAGVMSLEDAIVLVAARGELMDQTPPGTMLSVKASADALALFLNDNLSVGAINSPEDCTLSGTVEAVDAAMAALAEHGIECVRIRADHAYHSRFMEPVLDHFEAVAAKMELRAPRIPYFSNVTGRWITDEQATDPHYYRDHIRQTVQFQAGLETLLEGEPPVFVEVGPGRMLTKHVRATANQASLRCINVLRHRKEDVHDAQHLAASVGRLWEYGVAPDWKRIQGGQPAPLLPLPLYPFAEDEYPLDIEEFQMALGDAGDRGRLRVRVPERASELAEWEWQPSVASPVDDRGRVLLVLTDQEEELRRVMADVPRWRCLWVEPGHEYAFHGFQGATIRLDDPQDWARLLDDLAGESLLGDIFVVQSRDTGRALEWADNLLPEIVRVAEGTVDLLVLESDLNAQPVGLTRLLGRNLEHPRVRTKVVDLGQRVGDPGAVDYLRERLRSEVSEGDPRSSAVRYEGGRRLIRSLTPVAGAEQLFAATRSRHLVVCAAGDVDRVVDMARQYPLSGRLDILPLSRSDARGSSRNVAAGEGGVFVLPPIVADQTSDLVTAFAHYLKDAPVTDVLLWEAASNEGPSVEWTELIRGCIRAAREKGLPVGVLSHVTTEGEWTPQLTAWMAANSELDAAEDVVRLYQPLDASAGRHSPFDLVGRMMAAGVGTGYRGEALLSLVGALEMPAEDEQAGAPKQYLDLAGLLEAEIGKLVGYAEVDHHVSVFDLGLDSVRLVRLTNLLEKRGHKVVASDVYNNPTIAGLSRFIAESTRSACSEGGSLESVSGLLTEQLGRSCRLHRLEASQFGEGQIVLFVDGLDDESRSAVVGAVEALNLADDFVPHHIVPLEKEAAFLEEPTYASLGLGDGMDPDANLTDLFHAVDASQEHLRRIIGEGRLEGVYPINGTQQAHFEGETRLQLYLIRLRELLDLDVLRRALRDVVGRHGLMRSFLAKRDGLFVWEEYEPPMGFELPCLDLSHMTPVQQETMRSQLVQREWAADFKDTGKLMYHAILVKYNERSWDLLFQFDHSIFDVTSGQTLRGDLIKRYRELRRGTTRALVPAHSFRELQDQIYKGPVGITGDEIIERFELERWKRAMTKIKEQSVSFSQRRVRGIRYSIELDNIRGTGGDELETFSLVVQLYSRVLGRLTGVDDVAFDIIFRARGYEGRDYSEVMGMVLGVLPVVMPARPKAQNEAGQEIIQKFELLNTYNISFLNLVHDKRSEELYGRVLAVAEEGGADLRSTCLLNFVGNVENEYEEVWRMTLAQLEDEDQSKLDYADLYGISKINEGRLDLLILTRWVDDPEAFIGLLDEELADLTGRPGIISRKVGGVYVV